MTVVVILWPVARIQQHTVANLIGVGIKILALELLEKWQSNRLGESPGADITTIVI